MIETTLVPEDKRNDFLPGKLPAAFVAFEAFLFSAMSAQAPEYRGGYWDMYDLSNGSFYMAPTSRPEGFDIRVETNGYSGHMSQDAAGITASLVALNRLCWAAPADEEINDYYYQLRDFACDHAEAVAILGAID